MGCLKRIACEVGSISKRTIWFCFQVVVLYIYFWYWCLKKAYVVLFGEDPKIRRMDAAKIGKNLVKCVATGENVTLESLWEKQTCVITFLRRFG